MVKRGASKRKPVSPLQELAGTRKSRRISFYGFLIGVFTVFILLAISLIVYYMSLPSAEVAFCQNLASVNYDLSVRYDEYYEYMNSNDFLTDCLMDYAIRKNDESVCDDLSTRFVGNEYYVPICYGAVSAQKRVCDSYYSRDDPVENITRTRCLAGVAYRRLDSTICFDSHPNMASTCIDLVAELSGDSKYCDAYTYLDSRDDDLSRYDECLFTVLNFGHRGSTRKEVFLDYNLCFKFNNQNYRNICFHSMALRHRDIEICKYILDDERKTDCLAASSTGWSMENSPFVVVN